MYDRFQLLRLWLLIGAILNQNRVAGRDQFQERRQLAGLPVSALPAADAPIGETALVQHPVVALAPVERVLHLTMFGVARALLVAAPAQVREHSPTFLWICRCHHVCLTVACCCIHFIASR